MTLLYKVFRHSDGREAYGVCGSDEAVLYEADLPLAAATRIVQLENSENPPHDWEETAEILDAEGIDYAEPSVI